MYQKQYADKRLKTFIEGRVSASKAYLEACAWASFSNTHSILEISNMIDIIKDSHKSKPVYQYTRKTYFKDGHTTTEALERESLKSPKEFEGEVEDWHRKGQLTKHLDTLSPIQGYDYWITDKQFKANELSYGESHTISVS